MLLPTAPSDSPIAVNATVIDSNTIYLSWLPPLSEYQNGIIRKYFVMVINTVTGEIMVQNTTEVFTTISRLHPFYIYRLSVAGFTTEVGPFSEELLIRLPEDGKTKITLICI